jgi:hypothetical protein
MNLTKPEVPKLAPEVAIFFLLLSIHLSKYDPAILKTCASLPEVIHLQNNPNFDFLFSRAFTINQNCVPPKTFLFLNRSLKLFFTNVICIIVYNLAISDFERVKI